jgi:hypothetical protein
MNEHDKDDEKDQELTGWLRLWDTPRTPTGLSERLTESYRSRVRRRPVWKRLLEARISVPLPLAALLVGVALGIGILAGRQLAHGRPDRGDAGRSHVAGEGGLANLRPLPEVRLTVLKAGGSDDRR